MRPTGLAGLARHGPLRAAINLGNRALVQQEDGHLGGVSPALARRLAAEIGVPLEPVIYDGAGKVFADAGNDVWDVGFLAIDPKRAETVAFTRGYHAIEATYAVRTESPVREVEDADVEGCTVIVAQGSAYDLYLSRALERATVDRGGAPGDSFERFRRGEGDLVAGIRASLDRAFDGDPNYRVLPGCFLAVQQAMVLPYHDEDLCGLLDDFVARAIDDGFVARELGDGTDV